MTNTTQKEKAEGVFNGQNIKFNRVWGGHRFTDEEVAQLLAGNEINIDLANGTSATGKLAKKHYNGFTFWSFDRIFPKKEKAEGVFNGQNIKFNRVWGGHRFTDEEVAELLAGNQISITMESGTIVSGKLEKQSYNDHIFWGFNHPSEDSNESEAETVSTESEEVTIDEEPETEESANQSTDSESDDENFDMDF